MNVVILDSAFKHGISEYAINICLLHIIAEIILEAAPEKRLFVGFDHNANPLEIIAIIEGDTIVVIHAMKLRKQFYYLLVSIWFNTSRLAAVQYCLIISNNGIKANAVIKFPIQRQSISCFQKIFFKAGNGLIPRGKPRGSSLEE